MEFRTKHNIELNSVLTGQEFNILLKDFLHAPKTLFIVFQKDCGYRFLKIYNTAFHTWEDVRRDVEYFGMDPDRIFCDPFQYKLIDQSISLEKCISDLRPCTNYPDPVVYRFYIISKQ